MNPQSKLMYGWMIVAVACAVIATVVWHVVSQYIHNNTVWWVLFVPYILLVLFLEYRWYDAIFSPENLEDILEY